MVKVLNLDEFAPEPRRITYEGQEYEVVSPSMESYLAFLRGRGNLEEADPAEQIEIGVRMLAVTVPGLPEDKVRRMPVPQLLKLVDFVSEVIQGPSVGGESGEG